MDRSVLFVLLVVAVIQSYGSVQVQMPDAAELQQPDDDLQAQFRELQRNVTDLWTYIYELRTAVTHHLTHLRQHQVELESAVHRMEHSRAGQSESHSDVHGGDHHHSGEHHSHSGEHHSHSGEHHSHGGDQHSHSGEHAHSHSGDHGQHSHSGEQGHHSHSHSHSHSNEQGHSHSHSHSGEQAGHSHSHSGEQPGHSHSHSGEQAGHSHSDHADDHHHHGHKDSHESDDTQQQTQQVADPIAEPIVAPTQRQEHYHHHHHRVQTTPSSPVSDPLQLMNEHSHHHHHHHSHHHHEPPARNRNRTVVLPKYSEYSLYDFAVCDVQPNRAIPEENQQEVVGQVTFWQKKIGGPLNLHVRLRGFKIGDHAGHHGAQHAMQEEDNETPVSQAGHRHGFHVHALSDMSNGCQSTGPHYNPKTVNHGGPNALVRHVGDLGNIECDDHGVTNVVFSDDVASLRGQYSIIGKALVIHADTDDLGLGGDAESGKTGNAGTRIACCVIEKVEKLPIKSYKAMKTASPYQNR